MTHARRARRAAVRAAVLVPLLAFVAASHSAVARAAGASQAAALANADVSSDTDGFHTERVRAAALWSYASWLDYAGIAIQNTRYAQDHWSRDAAGVVGLWRRQDAATLAGIVAEGGVTQVAGHTRVIGDADWSFRPAKDTGVELMAAGDVVGTEKAIERGIAYGFYAASVERRLADRLTGIALAGYQSFTDGNGRTHLRARLIWQALPDQGVNIELRWRGYRSEQNDVGGAYFNPDRYRQWQGVGALRRHVGSWTISGALGAGEETVNGTETHPVRTAELRAEGGLPRGMHVAVHAVYNRSTGYVASPDYAWREGGVTLIVPF